jgi:hypothetical protein
MAEHRREKSNCTGPRKKMNQKQLTRRHKGTKKTKIKSLMSLE